MCKNPFAQVPLLNKAGSGNNMITQENLTRSNNLSVIALTKTHLSENMEEAEVTIDG